MKRSRQIALFAAAAVLALVAMALAQAKKTFDTPALAAGSAAPDYRLPDQDGLTHTLAADRGKVVLLAFYPADFTGGCTLEAHSLTAAYPDLKALGVTVYGVSVQDPKSHKAFCSKEGIPYTLLADTQKTVAQAYGVLIPGVGIANRVTFIVGTDGKIAYVDKAVNAHLMTCGADWVAWLKADKKPALSQGMSSIAAPRAAALGNPIPAFTLPDAATGTPTSLDTLSQGKKATVVMFVSTRCPVSNAYNDRMVALAKKYAPLGVAFVGIDSDENEPKAEIASFAAEHGFPFPILKDAGNKVSDMYHAHVTPETYVVNRQGVLVYHGRIDNNMDLSEATTHELADAINATLAAQPVAKAETKAFGCSIKR